ncbi:MAG: dynamin family protein, partial [Acidimicrobiales bacterium]|nr:dynamin family protein [Acidimicrobiales bacterium]
LSNVDEATARLGRSGVEVVVAGLLKRGKSTLFNALLGSELSSMRVTPETARPVYARYGARRARLVLVDDDGTERIEELDEPGEAARYAGRREGARRGFENLLRIEQWVPSELLKADVVLKDTPGLDEADADLAAELEELTYSELDNATAAILVLISPPGLAGLETKLLRGLRGRRVDKTFIVVNCYSEVWDDADQREAVIEHVREHVWRATAQEPKVFAVNGKRAWEARGTGNPAELEASGLAALLQGLERYLAGGALRQTLETSAAFLSDARSVAVQAIDERLGVLRDPNALEARRAERRERVDAARARLEIICSETEVFVEGAIDPAVEIICSPFGRLAEAVGSVVTTTELSAAEARFKVELEIAKARASGGLVATLEEAEHRAKAELLRSFGVLPEGAWAVDADDAFGAAVPTGVDLSMGLGANWGATGLAAGVGAAVGGSLLGGAGVALLAAGPIGFIAGAAIGALLAGSAARVADQKVMHETDRTRILGEVLARSARVEMQVIDVITGVRRRLVTELRSRFDSFASDELAELRAIEAFVKDGQRLAEIIERTEMIRADLAAVDLDV